MIKFNFSILNIIKSGSNKVAVRVKWNAKQCQVDMITGVYAEREKWDADLHKARKGTTHHAHGKTYTANEINERLAEYQQSVTNFMERCMLKGIVPTVTQLKKAVNRDMEQVKYPDAKPDEKKSVKALLETFLKEKTLEKNWDNKCREKYIQAYHHLMAANPRLRSVESINLKAMQKLKQWYIENGYKNRTVNKQIVMLKAFLKWINEQKGYMIPSAVLAYNTNLKVIRRTVTFLHYNELLHFANFHFKEERLEKARDLWCFMAFTSLRYSDLCNLKTGHICDNRIDMMTQKTSDHISIPLIDGALAILEKYKDKTTADGHVFDVITNQKLNDFVKEAAREAGLDRTVVNTYITGTKREEVQHKFYEIISCHDARRTFVSCSLAMGIPAQVVMKCTGHKGYGTMKPYIETATETQVLEMERWNRNQYRSQIISMLDTCGEKSLLRILDFIKSL